MYVPRDICPWESALDFSGLSGLRGCAGGCKCGGACAGMGGARRGMGLFDTPWDLSTWGFQEWGIALIAGYALFSMIFTSRTAQRSISQSVGARRKRRQKRASLKAELAETRSKLART